MIHTSLKQAFAFGNMIIIAILYLHSEPVVAENPHPASHIHRGLNEDILQCTVYELDAFTLTTNRDAEPFSKLSCAADNHGPTVFLEGSKETFFSSNLVSGVTSLTIPTHLVSAHLKVDLDDPKASEMITISHGHQNRGLRGYDQKKTDRGEFEGTFGILVVRVSDTRNHSPTYSADEISKHLFTDDLTMTSQYRACSNDKLHLVPADGSDVVNGVLDITVDVDLSRSYSSNECVVAADNVISSSSYDLGTHKYTMYVCPDVVDFGVAVGFADVNGAKSWYLDTYGSMPFVQMHEFGHNLGFHHSSVGAQEYGDPTGVMGGQFKAKSDWGRMCFNAFKTYTTGWYSEYRHDMKPSLASYNGNIVDVNSASLGRIRDGDDMVVRIQTPNNMDNMYFMLHRLEGITGDMLSNYQETHAGRVNIVKQEFPQGVPSQFVASLASGEEYIEYNWAGTGKDLHIEVCSIADDSSIGGAHVIAFLEGEKSTSCDDTILAPTPAPSLRSSPSPTVALTRPSPTCVDSTLKMFIRGGSIKSCSWVAANNTEERCMIPGVASHCPVTCGTCIMCVDSGKRFQMKNEAKDIKSCSWVRRASTISRCEKEGVASACRATCGTCKA